MYFTTIFKSILPIHLFILAMSQSLDYFGQMLSDLWVIVLFYSKDIAGHTVIFEQVELFPPL